MLVFGGIPYFYRVSFPLFAATRYDFFAVGTVGDGGAVGGSDGAEGFVADVPETDGPVSGGGDESMAVSAQHDSGDLLGVAGEGLCADAA